MSKDKQPKDPAEVGFRLLDVRPLGGMTSSALHGNTDEDEENEKIMILKKVNVGS